MINFEQFLSTMPADHQPFVHELHDIMLDNACKATFEEMKSGMTASIKFGKPPRALANFLLRKKGLLVRIYGENFGGYSDFLDTLPPEMVQSIQDAGDCKRITQNKCSPKCKGYDFTIADDHFQKCRYGCFEFLVTDESKPFIKAFVKHEINERAAN